MTMPAILEKPAVERFLANARPGDEVALTRAVMQSLVSRTAACFTVDAPDAATVTRVMTRLRVWLLATGAFTGGVSATVSPTLLGETYPAMLALVRALERANANGLWKPDGARTVRFGDATHIFVSADMPVRERTPAPDRLLEVADAHRIQAAWYDARVAPRARQNSLTRVLFGTPGTVGSVYDRERSRNLSARESTQRHFSLDRQPAASGQGW